MSFHNFLMWKLRLHWTELSCSYCNLPRDWGALRLPREFCTLRASWKQYGMGAVKSIFRTEKTTQFVGNPDGFKNITDQLQWWIIHTFTSKCSLGYFIVICPLVVSFSDTLQFHACAALCCIWTTLLSTCSLLLQRRADRITPSWLSRDVLPGLVYV